MSRSRHHRKGQVAVEVLFITAIILTGILIIVPAYLDENREISTVTYVKTSASHACTYLNAGVIVNTKDGIYDPLNSIITASDYTYTAFRVTSITTSKAGNTMTVKVTISYSGMVAMEPEQIETNILRFIVNDISRNTDAQKVTDQTLNINGETVIIEVNVVRT
ncbi:hypothetical protein E3E38_04890 [Thermococcus sp. 18S1]|uniref:hypothetical protein n=1 Tax=Thermococcus sp. 18S1 TaxID=1638210 RepID=UPI001439E227|nr:hypothetical protein [Thermococcus sp. 18S1]NJE30388.1 hypothetical protein [Thermococcus sp. 18S1]